MKKYLKSAEHIIVISAIILGATFLIGLKDQDINFCRSALKGMTQGVYAVEKKLDWENLIFFQVDIGATYRQLPSEAERRNYKMAFIKSLSQSFSNSKEKGSVFKNWRVLESSVAPTTIITADSLNGRLIFILIKQNGQRKIQSIGLSRKVNI